MGMEIPGLNLVCATFNWLASKPSKQLTLQEFLFPKRKLSIPFNRAGRFAERMTMAVGLGYMVSAIPHMMAVGLGPGALPIMLIPLLVNMKISATVVGALSHGTAAVAELLGRAALVATGNHNHDDTGAPLPWNPEVPAGQQNADAAPGGGKGPQAVEPLINPDPMPAASAELEERIQRAHAKRLFQR